jgi:hypothetical protein
MMDKEYYIGLDVGRVDELETENKKLQAQLGRAVLVAVANEACPPIDSRPSHGKCVDADCEECVKRYIMEPK